MTGGYALYEEGVVGNGDKAVLFFYLSSDSASISMDDFLRDTYAIAEVPIKTYRIDFGADANLQRQYGVSKANTIVLIDEDGTAIKKEASPAVAEAKRLIYGNVGSAKPSDTSEELVDNDDDIENYDDCIAAGYSMMKSYPAQCQTKGGKRFVQEVDDADDVSFGGEYMTYQDGVIGNGEESVLFFHAAWCPYCIANDASLDEWYQSEVFPVSVYKIDYDTATELKQRFGVTQQDTFIRIDGDGNEIKRIGFPSESALRDLLQ